MVLYGEPRTVTMIDADAATRDGDQMHQPNDVVENTYFYPSMAKDSSLFDCTRG